METVSTTLGASDQEFAGFFREEYEAVVRTTFLILHDRERARDVAQEACISLFTHWNKIREYERPARWVRRVAIRSAVRTLQRERARPRLERELDPASMPIPVDIDLLRAIHQLPPAQRAAVVLFYFEDRPVSQVADILRCSEVTAKVYLHRARKRLADLLVDTGSEEVARDAS
jgi:RNA polymerase sigma factor (sigma-70 family)